MKSLSDSPLDEMILLLHSKAPKYQRLIPRYVRTVMYENIAEVPDRLRAATAVRAGVRAPVDLTRGGRPAEPENEDGQQKRPDLPEEDVLNPSEDEAPVDSGGQEEATPSPEEVRAALTIGAAYRRVMARKKADLKRVRLWSLLHDRASSMEWPKEKRYKLLMQGPLGHVLACLDDIKMFADQANRDLTKQLHETDHTMLEELIERSDTSR